MHIIDITKQIRGVAVYPGDPEPRLGWLCRMGQTSDFNLSAFSMCSHTGTHADAPLHFLEDGKSIDQCDLEAFVGPCTVMEVQSGVITGEDAEKILPAGCERLLIKGEGRAFFMDASAEIFADSGLRLIGTDALSVGCVGNEMKPHKAFLQNDIAVLEGLDLSAVSPGNYYLFAAPIKLTGLEAAPVRAVLIDDYIFWGGNANR